MNRIRGERLLAWVLGAGTVLALAAVLYVFPSKRVPEAWAPINVTVTDPDADDQFEGIWKTRANTDGKIRGKVEADVLDLVPGKQYTIQVIVIEFESGARSEATTPKLTAQPPR